MPAALIAVNAKMIIITTVATDMIVTIALIKEIVPAAVR